MSGHLDLIVVVRRVSRLRAADLDLQRVRGPHRQAVVVGDARRLARRDEDPAVLRREAWQARQHTAEFDQVLALGVDHRVGAQALQENIVVVVQPANQTVQLQTGIESVDTRSTGQDVLAASGHQDIVPRGPGQCVITVAPGQHDLREAARQRGDLVVAGTAEREATALPEQDRVVALAAVHEDRHIRQQRLGIQRVLAGPELDHDLGDPRELLVIAAVEFHVDRGAAAAQDELFCAVHDVDELARGCGRPCVKVEHALTDFTQDRLRIRRSVVQIEERLPEDLLLAVEQRQAEGLDLGVDLGVDIGLEVQIEQPAQAGEIDHGLDLGTPDLAVAGQIHVRDLAVLVAHHGGRAQVVEVDPGLALDAALDATDGTGAEDHGVDLGVQTQVEVEAEFVLVDAARAGHEGTVPEVRQGHITDVEPVEDVPVVPGVHRLLHAVGVVAESEVDLGAQPAEGPDVEGGLQQRQAQQRRQRQREQHHIELEVIGQQGHLVGEERGIASAQQLGPVADVGDVLPDLEARTVARLAALRAKTHLVHLVDERGRRGGQGPTAAEQAVDLRSVLPGRLRRPDPEHVPEHQIAAGALQALDEIRQLHHEAGGVQEGPVDRVDALDARLLVVSLDDGVDHTLERRVVQQQVQPLHRGVESLDHRLDRVQRIGDLLGDGLEEILDEGAQVQPQVLDVEARCTHGLSEHPVPIEHDVAAQLGHDRGARDRQGDAETHVRAQPELQIDRPARVADQLRHRQAARGVARQIDAQPTADPAGLEAWRDRIVVPVDHLRLHEQETSRPGKWRDRTGVER